MWNSSACHKWMTDGVKLLKYLKLIYWLWAVCITILELFSQGWFLPTGLLEKFNASTYHSVYSKTNHQSPSSANQLKPTFVFAAGKKNKEAHHVGAFPVHTWPTSVMLVHQSLIHLQHANKLSVLEAATKSKAIVLEKGPFKQSVQFDRFN